MSSRKSLPNGKSVPQIQQTQQIPSDISEPNESYYSLDPCLHLQKVLSSSAKEMVIRNYALGVKVSLLANPSTSNTSTYKSKTDGNHVAYSVLLNYRAKALKCNDCLNNCSTTYMCLQCPNIGCLANEHGLLHTKKSGHIFGIDAYLGLLFCFKCGDYVSDPSLELVRSNYIKSINQNNPIIPIYPKFQENEFIAQNSQNPSYQAKTGLRGFVNMGSTCFMSSILQTLIHNPFIRDFFLSGSHFNCTKNKNECITCCIDEIFIEFYTKNYTNGYGPVNLLTAAWNTKRSLAGYSEQDAHEFWQFLVDELHKYHIENNSDIFQQQDAQAKDPSPHSEITTCSCIAHKVFAGELQSSITCLKCETITTTIDPMIDLSLEINNSNFKALSLYECLNRFTKLEDLDVMYNCSNCKIKTKAVKQLGIKNLPPVLGIQLKRFEHNSTSSKIESHISFPLFLDMGNYIIQKQQPHQKVEKIYELFSLICHIGSVNTGHYICIVKNKDGKWFKFDDSVISVISQEEVINTKAYLLFYIVHQI